MVVITSDDILGKEAIAPNGRVLGVVIKLHLDNISKKTVGITVDMGMLSPDLYVGIDNVNLFGRDAVLIRKLPFNIYKGMDVHTASGMIVGRVKDVRVEGDDLKGFLILPVKARSSHKNWREVSVSYVRDIGSSIILKNEFTFLDTDSGKEETDTSDSDDKKSGNKVSDSVDSDSPDQEKNN